MYAVVKAGGKQHKVAVGDVVEVNRLEGESGDAVSLPALLLVDGRTVISETSALAKIAVTGEIVGHHKGPKIKILKYKNKTGYRKRIGHRQLLTELLVTDIDDGKPKKKAKPETVEAEAGKDEAGKDESVEADAPEADAPEADSDTPAKTTKTTKTTKAVPAKAATKAEAEAEEKPSKATKTAKTAKAATKAAPAKSVAKADAEEKPSKAAKAAKSTDADETKD